MHVLFKKLSKEKKNRQLFDCRPKNLVHKSLFSLPGIKIISGFTSLIYRAKFMNIRMFGLN
jgi:hypothetical protein